MFYTLYKYETSEVIKYFQYIWYYECYLFELMLHPAAIHKANTWLGYVWRWIASMNSVCCNVESNICDFFTNSSTVEKSTYGMSAIKPRIWKSPIKYGTVKRYTLHYV